MQNDKSNSGQIRQGDVLLLPVSELPSNAVPVILNPTAQIILAYGEATGHAHVVDAMQAHEYRSGDNRYIKVLPTGTVLRHEEHLPLPIKPGIYKVVLQREYTPAAIRTVAD